MKNDNHALFIMRCVKTVHERMIISIDSQHGHRKELAAIGHDPGLVNAGDAHRHALRKIKGPSNGFARSVMGLVKTFGCNDAALALAPGRRVSWLGMHRFAAGVVGLACPIKFHDEVWNEPEDGVMDDQLGRRCPIIGRHADHGGQARRKNVNRGFIPGSGNPKKCQQPVGTGHRNVVGTHG